MSDNFTMNTPKKLLPNHARLVYKGKIFKVYQWEQELYDGSKTIFEKMERPGTVEIIASVDGEIIMTEQEQPHRDPFVALPGGRIDDGEDPISAAARELLEETGYTSEQLTLWKSFQEQSSVLWPKYIFLAPHCKKMHNGTPDAGEKIIVKSISFDDFLLLSENKYFRSSPNMKEQLYLLRLYPEMGQDLKKMLF